MTKAAKPAEKEPLLYLKQVRIQKHAPILDAKVDFKPGLNIIIGPNGVGKTRFVSLAGQSARIDALPTEDSLNCELLFGYYRDIEVSSHSDGRIGGSSPNSYLTSSKASNVRVEMFVMPRVRYKGEAQWDDQCVSHLKLLESIPENMWSSWLIMAHRCSTCH